MNEARPPDDLEWSPARSGGAIFGTHRARFEGKRVVFSPARGSYVLLGVIAGIGVITVVACTLVYLQKQDEGALVVAGVMGVMTLVLLIMLYRLLFNHRVFDRGLGCYWDTRDGGTLRQPGAKALPLGHVRGVQITCEHVSGGDANFDSDELNLVLAEPMASGRTRVNVVDHGDAEGLRTDAERLAKWLGVPLWGKSSS